jgi:hypothetical protein
MTNNTVGSASAALRLQNNSSGAAAESKIDTAPPPWTRRNDAVKFSGNDSGKGGNNSGNSTEVKYKAPSFPPMTVPVSENGSESRVRHRNKPEVPHGPRVAPNHPPAHFDEPLVTSDSPGRVHKAGAEVLQGLKNNPVRAVMHPGASVFASVATFLFRLLRPANTET